MCRKTAPPGCAKIDLLSPSNFHRIAAAATSGSLKGPILGAAAAYIARSYLNPKFSGSLNVVKFDDPHDFGPIQLGKSSKNSEPAKVAQQVQPYKLASVGLGGRRYKM